MFPLSEPQRGKQLITYCQGLSETFPWINEASKIGADVFLLIYPIFLVAFYLYGIYKKDQQAKEGALFIFLSCVISLVVNIVVQLFFTKARPLVEFMNVEIQETPLHRFLPESSFPSDHAVVGMSIAVATLLRSLRTQQKKLKYFSIFLLICAVLMGVSRVFTFVHRPSDILGGFLLGCIVPLLLNGKFLFSLLRKWVILPLIRFQEWVFGLASGESPS